MKWNKSAILAVAFSGIMACGQLVNAQNAPTNTVPRHLPGPGAGQGGPFRSILEQLNLTDDQRQKVMPIVKENMKKMREVQQEGALTPEEKMGQVKDIMEATGTRLKGILTPEQYTKFQELAKNMREKRAAVNGKARMPGAALPSNLPTNSVPSPGLGQNTN